MQIAIFTSMYQFFDENVTQVITTGSANMIHLVMPLVTAGFGLYVLLILMSYWRGQNTEPVMDFLFRMVGWSVICAFGLNIQYYSHYVVPFVNGSGEEIAQGVLGGNTNAIAGLDSIASAYADAGIRIMTEAKGIENTVIGILTLALMLLTGVPFMVLAAIYIIIARLALGILLAMGPLFIAAALFPATRQLFTAWTGQCINYILMVVVFTFVAAIEINFATNMIPKDDSLATVSGLVTFAIMGVALFFFSLEIPKLVSALAGGVGISTITSRGAINAAKKLLSLFQSKNGNGAKGRGGGEIKGANRPEQK